MKKKIAGYETVFKKIEKMVLMGSGEKEPVGMMPLKKDASGNAAESGR